MLILFHLVLYKQNKKSREENKIIEIYERKEFFFYLL